MLFLILQSRINGTAEKEREIEEENRARVWGGGYNRAATVLIKASVDSDRESDFIKAISRPCSPVFLCVLLFDKEISRKRVFHNAISLFNLLQ